MSSPPLTDAGRDCSVPKDLGIPLRRRYQGGATRMLDQGRREFSALLGGAAAAWDEVPCCRLCRASLGRDACGS
jgi:hypothetical protein